MDFVAEAEPTPVVGPLPGSGVTLANKHKLAVIIELTSELMNSSNAEELLRALLVAATAPALDRPMLSAVAAGPERPAGLLHGVTQLSSSSSLTDDLMRLISAVCAVAGNGQVVLIGAPDVGAAVGFLPRNPLPTLISTSLPSGALVGLAAPALFSASEAAPRVDASTQGTINEESGPAAIISDTGIVARPVRSFFQSDVVGVRVRWPVFRGR
jgi:hypothetical protein